jgi:hypothetical protein
MFTRKPIPTELQKLDEAIDSVYADMAGFTSDAEEYSDASDQLVKLIKLKKEMTPSMRVSADTLALIASNLLGIALILGYERVNVVT